MVFAVVSVITERTGNNMAGHKMNFDHKSIEGKYYKCNYCGFTCEAESIKDAEIVHTKQLLAKWNGKEK
jgi:rubrerythrin